MTAEGFAVAFALFVALLAGSLRANASAPDTAVTLAQLCIGERSARIEHREVCTAMVLTIVRRAEGRPASIRTHARAYSAVFRGRRPWILELDRAGTRPPSWRGARWSVRRPQWLALIAHVERVLAGDVPDPCKAEPTEFGCEADGRGREGWTRVCAHVDDRQWLWVTR